MKLKDKFKIINCKDCDMPYCDIKCTILAPSELIKLEQVADEFAIGFSEWCIKWRVEFVDDTREGVLYNYGGLYKKLTMNEILEIYKKEKGL